MNVNFNFNAEALPDPSDADQQQLREMLPGLLDEGAMNILVRVAPTIHAHYLITRHPDNADLKTQPQYDPRGVWAWDLQRQEWMLAEFATIVAAETFSEQHLEQLNSKDQ